MSFWRQQPDLSVRPGTEHRTQPLIVVDDDDRDTRELYCASAALKHPLPERDVAVRYQQHDRAAAVVDSQRQDL